MTSSALLLAILGSCEAITVRMYADRKELPLEGIIVNMALCKQDNVSLEAKITRKIAETCPLHQLLSNPIKIITS